MHDTVIDLSKEQEARFAQGHDAQHHVAHAWHLDALAGAGAIRSTASDMLTYVEVQLHPERARHVPGASIANSPSGTLASALELSQRLRTDVGPSTKIGLAWLYQTETGNYWHNGATGGYSSYSFFNPKADYAAVVLFNTTISGNGSFADRLGEHIAERLQGKPAIALGP
jgi:serine-type D-Ala-D-Ala carboxypeptidase/endopeptidase